MPGISPSTSVQMRDHETETIPEASLAAAVIEFGRTLKENGMSVSLSSVMDALKGVRWVGVEDVRDFKIVLKAVFLTRKEESELFDRLFAQFWLGWTDGETPLAIKAAGAETMGQEGDDGTDDLVAAQAGLSESQETEAWNARPYVVYSLQEVLRDRDFRELPEGDDPRIARMIREILDPFLKRSATQKRPVESGLAVDFRRLLRKSARYGGEILELPRLKPKRRVKKLVFLCDVSGSMNPYLRFMLRFIKEIQRVPTKVETFVFATRLDRITPILVRLPFHRAMVEITRTVKDWSGGTRIGACLKEFTSYGGGGMLSSSTVVLIHSDGWDRGDPDLLERQMTRIQRRAYRVLWINPLLGSPHYEPVCRGMRVALPHVDSFLPGHSVSALERLARTLRSLS